MSPMTAELGLSDRFFSAYRRSGARGFHLLRRAWVGCWGSPQIRVQSRFGAVYEVNPYGYVDDCILRHGFYESEVFEALQSYFGPGAVFWDIGSNLGLHAVAAKVVSPATVVCAFEPVPELLGCVRANAALNSIEVTTCATALSARTETARLHMPRGGRSGRASLLPLPDVADTETVSVDCARADELIRSGHMAAPTVIKLDVEGAEPEVLDGFGDYLREPRLRAVAFEGNPNSAEAETRDPVGSRLCRAGFRLRRLERQEPTHHLLENYLAYRP